MASCCSSPFHTLLSYPGSERQRRCMCPPDPGGLSQSLLLGDWKYVDGGRPPTSAAQSAADESGGFWTCTESLGFESSDERAMDERDETEEQRRSDEGAEKGRSLMRKTEDRKRVGTNFPPPLPGLELNGRMRSFMKAERGDGRLRLTEVKVEGPEILRAFRDGGRLRLEVVVGPPGAPPLLEDGEEEIQENEEAEGEKVSAAAQFPKVSRRRRVRSGHLHPWSPCCMTTA